MVAVFLSTLWANCPRFPFFGAADMHFLCHLHCPVFGDGDGNITSKKGARTTIEVESTVWRFFVPTNNLQFLARHFQAPYFGICYEVLTIQLLGAGNFIDRMLSIPHLLTLVNVCQQNEAAGEAGCRASDSECFIGYLPILVYGMPVFLLRHPDFARVL